ncbi:YhbY family RNA-binding protein [Scatolibacter rhodanostii]|uniref:YhbY family RNA-binding protein n=1 Tax=Scatolibacter rhodanostii TaxID=2014781 RepID=UPI000C08078E|nr:YhbY family RNA-binding protein [Scatolibacter rhodanostii]
MLTSKQRAFLRSLAVNADTILMVGKNGISDDLIQQAGDALVKRELIKGKVLTETSPISPREAAEKIADATKSEVVQVIGSKFCLYKRNHKEPKIILPKQSRK